LPLTRLSATTEIATPSDLTASLPCNNFTLGDSSLDTINTGLSISDQFPGAVTLPNLVNASIQLVGAPKVTSTLTSLLFPNLSSANAIYFWSCDSLETISLPNLWQADDINIQNLTNLSSGIDLSHLGVSNPLMYAQLGNITNQGGLGEVVGEIAGIEIVNTTAPFKTIGAPLPNPEAEKLTSIGKINFLEIYSNFLLEQTTVYAVNITTLQIENCKNVTIVAFTIGVFGLATIVDIDYLDASTVIETGSTLLENNSFTNLNFSQLKVAAIPGSILGSLAGIPPCYLWISGNWKLENKEFDSLESVESNLTISNNTVLSDISFPSLLSVAGAIIIEVNGP
jgi:hypothetical protein